LGTNFKVLTLKDFKKNETTSSENSVAAFESSTVIEEKDETIKIGEVY
jgi:hypothetical protein